MLQQAFTVLIAEDEPHMRELVMDYFTGKGAQIFGAENGSAALELLARQRVDIVLLDVMMPGADGFTVCSRLRSDPRYRENAGVPVLFLSALGQEEDKLQGYALGADDYITKPFSLAVLYAKTAALLKRTKPAEVSAPGSLLLDPDHRTAAINGVTQKLPRKEFELLQYLSAHPDRLLTRDQLLRAVWGYDYDGEDRTVDNHIRKLRARGISIETEYGLGYRYSPQKGGV